MVPLALLLVGTSAALVARGRLPLGTAHAPLRTLARPVLSIDDDEGGVTDWDGAWKQFAGEKAAELDRPDLDTPAPRPPPAAPSPQNTFRLEPQADADGRQASRPGQDALLNAWVSERTLFGFMGVLAVVFAFYVYVGVTGGITDGYDRTVGPSEGLAETLARMRSEELAASYIRSD